MGQIVDLFAGPGGWDEGLLLLGRSDVVGIEHDLAACQTAMAAGHRRILADASTYPAERFVGFEGLIASPPCQDFSLAGKMAGRTGDKGQLIDLVPEWVRVIRPEWVACEQVAPALPVWREFAHLFRSWGYSTWCGMLNAADFGVPQTRERAILLASRVDVAGPPAATHAEGGTQAGLFGPGLLPWVGMAEALGWPEDALVEYQRGEGMIERHGARPGRTGAEPCFTLRAGASGESFNFRVRTGANSMKTGRTAADVVPYEREIERPSPTVDGKAGHAWKVVDGEARIRFTIRDALVLQSFRADYPLHGNKTKQSEQVGNAVPPLLAAHVLAALTGTSMEMAA